MKNIEGKYFIDEEKYNCPFCNNKGIKYILLGIVKFDENKSSNLYAIFIECSHCHKISMHLSKYDFSNQNSIFFLVNNNNEFKTYSQHVLLKIESKVSFYKKNNEEYTGKSLPILNYQEISEDEKFDIDEKIILNIPSSFFITDNRIPKKLRELIIESEKCVKNNCLTGASACIRKTIYELIVIENLEGSDYKSKIKSMKGKYLNLDNTYVDVLTAVQGITSDQVHEKSYENFNATDVKAYIELLKEVFNEIYVIPNELSVKHEKIASLFSKIKKTKKDQT